MSFFRDQSMRFRFNAVTLVMIVLITLAKMGCDVIPNPVGAPAARFVNIAEPSTDSPALAKSFEAALFDTIAGRVGHHGGTIAAFDDDALLAAWYSYRGPEELDGAAIFLSRKSHGDENWSTPVELTGLPDPAANPLLVVDGDRVRLFFAHAPLQWWSASLWLAESQDRGVTWSTPAQLPLPAGANVRNPPIKFDDGSLLLPAYSDFWLNGLMLREDRNVPWRVNAVYGPEDDILLQPAVAQIDGDSLLLVGRNRGGAKLLYATSDDRGETWSAARRSPLPNPDSAASLTQLQDGSLLLIFNDDPELRTPLVAMVSSDGGISWSGRTVIAEGAGAFSYPSVVQASNGNFHVTYSENRTRIVYQVWEQTN